LDLLASQSSARIPEKMIVFSALMAVVFMHASAQVCDMPYLCSKMDQSIKTGDDTYELLKRGHLSTRLHSTMLGIEQSKFVVSGVYNERIYLATKVEAVFDINAANEDCKSQGGYLLELDDSAESDYVIDFVKKVGGPDTEFGTGGNDLVNEGFFRYINSGKAIPSNLPWYPGEPNNNGPNGAEEDCMMFWSKDKKLNDASCKLSMKYVCEVPLRDI
ncbi:C-type lectin domain-containing protein, partial [Klebsiella pneumoniae]